MIPSALRTLSCLGLVGWVLAAPVMAQVEERLHIQSTKEGHAIPLGWLNANKSTPIELRGADARATLKLPIANRIAIDEARLELVYTQSVSLLPRSQLAVTLDERVLAQLPAKAEQPDLAARISLPAESLKPGFRDLGFRASQHYTNECEDPSAPELYTQVDATHSWLRLKTHLRPVTASLARLGDIFDKRLWLEHYPLQLLLPQGAMADKLLLEAAAQASQGIAGMLDFMPMTVRVGEITPTDGAGEQRRFPGLRLQEDGFDAILLGTRGQLQGLVHPDILARIKEGYIGLFASDQDPTRAILLVSGTTSEEVLRAATVLNLPGIAWPDRMDAVISELKLDQGYNRSLLPQSDKAWTTFANMGFKTTTMKGMYPPPAQLEFWAYRELLDPANRYIEAELNFAYGAGFDKKSALNVLLNDQFVQALPLQDKHGDQVWGAKVKIPTVSLVPGKNTLKFLPSVIGEDVGGACTPIFTENLYVTVFEDSRIELPPIADFMGIPDLSLLAKTGLPYTRKADGLGTALWLADLQPSTVGSALTLLAKLRQVHQLPLTGLRLVTKEAELSGLEGLLVVGDVQHLPAFIQEEMISFLPGQRWQTVQLGSFQRIDLDHGIRRWLKHPTEPLARQAKTSQPAMAGVSLREGLGESVAMVQYTSNKLGIPITVLTAASPERLHAGSMMLSEHRYWNAMAGSATLWDQRGEAVTQALPVTHDYIGEHPAVSPVSYLLSDRPWLAVLVSLSLVLLVSVLTWWLLKQRARRLKLEE